MRRSSNCLVRSVALLALLFFGVAGQAAAGLLNPGDFAPVGPFPTDPGSYTFDTTGPNPTLSGPGGTALTGVIFNGVAVFDFNSITVGSGQTFVGEGALPLALLSRSDITINGTIDVSAPGGSNPNGGPGGFGGGNDTGAGGYGPGGGGGGAITSFRVPQPPLPPQISYSFSGGGGGGGFGGYGYAGMPVPFIGTGTGVSGGAAGGSGGRAYADLLGQLQGGSGGGASINAPGGGGGGAIELGAVGNISVKGSVLANGGNAPGLLFGGGGGGGAGGGILLHGEGVTLSGLLSAIGGNGGRGGDDSGGPSDYVVEWGAGGNGGGGQVVIDPGAGGFTSMSGTIDVGNGTFNVVPEPASLVLFGLGLLGVLVCARYTEHLRAV
ncbi:MAG: PEP-CTERM sorting domain-containing protein [Isosphaeraceae bacterium]